MAHKFFFSIVAIILLSFVAAGCRNQSIMTSGPTAPPQKQESAMTISSPAFAPNESIPSQYTCDGANINPPLVFKDVPAGAKSLALILEDPDAPNGTFVHWVLANIDPAAKGIKEGDMAADTTQQVLNGMGKPGYMGPCPPSGTHHYHFKLFALDTAFELDRPNAAILESTMQGHIISQAELVAIYQKK